jgi:hypothetical protein
MIYYWLVRRGQFFADIQQLILFMWRKIFYISHTLVSQLVPHIVLFSASVKSNLPFFQSSKQKYERLYSYLLKVRVLYETLDCKSVFVLDFWEFYVYS